MKSEKKKHTDFEWLVLFVVIVCLIVFVHVAVDIRTLSVDGDLGLAVLVPFGVIINILLLLGAENATN